jgi:tRNA (mo5U34)-methyltransferase
VVGGKMRDRHINLMAQFQIKYNLSKDYFVNKNVIDIGCWTGGTTLLLKALGANEILALEEVQKYATTATTLISDIYEQKNVTCNGGNVYNLETDKKYDVAYFPGVIYHLSDPILALRRVFNSLKDGGEIYIESMGLNNDNSICKFSGNARGESDRDLTDKKGWNWFIPSSLCLKNWLIEAGFREVDCFFSDASKQLGHGRRVYGYGKRKKYVDITRAGFSRPDVE